MEAGDQQVPAQPKGTTYLLPGSWQSSRSHSARVGMNAQREGEGGGRGEGCKLRVGDIEQ